MSKPDARVVDNPWREFIENCMSGDNYFRGGEYHELLADLDRGYRAESLLAEAESRLVKVCDSRDKDRAFIKKLDGIIEEVGGVTASCINPYEDLKNALIGQKVRAEKAEAQRDALQAQVDAVRALADKYKSRHSRAASLGDRISADNLIAVITDILAALGET